MKREFEKALYTSKPGLDGAIAVFPDRFVLTGPPPAWTVTEMPFADIRALARNPREDFGAWARGAAFLAVHFNGEWVALPAIPEKLANELMAQAESTGMIEVVGWPWGLDASTGLPVGPIVVREYANARDFELDARTMDLAGYDVLSTTQQEQGANAMGYLVGGPLLAMATKGQAHIVVTYKRR